MNIQWLLIVLCFAVVLPFGTMSSYGADEKPKKEMGPGKACAKISGRLATGIVRHPVTGLVEGGKALCLAGKAVGEGKYGKAIAHTVSAPLIPVVGVISGVTSLAVSPFPLVAGAGMVAYNAATKNRKKERTPHGNEDVPVRATRKPDSRLAAGVL